jgi:hypothetical protein
MITTSSNWYKFIIEQMVGNNRFSNHPELNFYLQERLCTKLTSLPKSPVDALIVTWLVIHFGLVPLFFLVYLSPLKHTYTSLKYSIYSNNERKR